MDQVNKTSKEIADTTKIGLRTVQHIIKNWKDSEEPSSLGKKCDQKKQSWMIEIGDHLNVWWNQIIRKKKWQ